MEKTDFKKTLKHLYNPSPKGFSIADVPAMNFLMIDGKGSPGDAEYSQAVEALYPVAYKLKFMSKKSQERDYAVPPLEGLWWADDMSDFVTRRKERWIWCMMIMQPDWISAEMVDEAIALVVKSKDLPALAKLRFEAYEEGKAVQILHIGSYEDETPVLADMHENFIPANGFAMTGMHHEIYISDPRKVAPEKLKTVLRQPVANA
jgi:hypothetical protein